MFSSIRLNSFIIDFRFAFVLCLYLYSSRRISRIQYDIVQFSFYSFLRKIKTCLCRSRGFASRNRAPLSSLCVRIVGKTGIKSVGTPLAEEVAFPTRSYACEHDDFLTQPNRAITITMILFRPIGEKRTAVESCIRGASHDDGSKGI